jgi:hypothetical protein
MMRFLFSFTKTLIIFLIICAFLADVYILNLNAVIISRQLIYGVIFLSAIHTLSLMALIISVRQMNKRFINLVTTIYLAIGFINAEIAYYFNQNIRDVAIFIVVCHLVSALLIRLAFYLEKKQKPIFRKTFRPDRRVSEKTLAIYRYKDKILIPSMAKTLNGLKIEIEPVYETNLSSKLQFSQIIMTELTREYPILTRFKPIDYENGWAATYLNISWDQLADECRTWHLQYTRNSLHLVEWKRDGPGFSADGSEVKEFSLELNPDYTIEKIVDICTA